MLYRLLSWCGYSVLLHASSLSSVKWNVLLWSAYISMAFVLVLLGWGCVQYSTMERSLEGLWGWFSIKTIVSVHHGDVYGIKVFLRTTSCPACWWCALVFMIFPDAASNNDNVYGAENGTSVTFFFISTMPECTFAMTRTNLRNGRTKLDNVNMHRANTFMKMKSCVHLSVLVKDGFHLLLKCQLR